MNFSKSEIDWDAFGTAVKLKRVEKGYSQADVAKLLGISQAQVSLVERGSGTAVSDERLEWITSLFGIHETDLPRKEKTPGELGNSIFISYSHQDSEFLKRLQVHLAPLKASGKVQVWDDTELVSGDDWKKEIEKALGQARAAILLISADFLASDFIVKNELPPLLQSAKTKGVTIIPVILKPCGFQRDKNLSAFQSVNPPDDPLSGMEEHGQELVYDAVAERVATLFEPTT